MLPDKLHIAKPEMKIPIKNLKSLYFIFLLSLFMAQNAEAQDWANLKKYQNQNAALQPLKPGQKRIVFMGDSITEFWSVTGSDFFADKPYINRGISGQTTPQMILRFRQDVLALKPAGVVILAGINDIAGNTGPSTLEMTTDNIISMVELARANHIKVILCSLIT